MWAIIGGFVGLVIGAMLDYSENCSSFQQGFTQACSGSGVRHSYDALVGAAIGTLVGWGVDYLSARNERHR